MNLNAWQIFLNNAGMVHSLQFRKIFERNIVEDDSLLKTET